MRFPHVERAPDVGCRFKQKSVRDEATGSSMKEREVIDRLRAAFPASGIGDDTAVLPGSAELHGGEAELLFASDGIVEGVHFTRETSTLSQAIQKLVTSNVSDVYAMGGRPAAIVFTAALTNGMTAKDVDEIIDGLKKACDAYAVKLAGGDTVSSPSSLFFDVAIMGTVSAGRAVPRSGARPGDSIVLLGEIGASFAGLAIVSALAGRRGGKGAPLLRPPIGTALAHAGGFRETFRDLNLTAGAAELAKTAERFREIPHVADILRCVKQHLVPFARPSSELLVGGLAPKITSMIDISDGLAKDLRTLCDESDVGAIIHEEALPVSASIAALFRLDGEGLVDFAISSGEEYVLLATARLKAGHARTKRGGYSRGARVACTGGTVIGTIVPADEGITLIGTGAARRPLPALGYEHSF